ncbi:glycosyltransferase family 2 protein [Clostridium sp. LIBA-8841]|uniref:glycosyltransferase family 2 protein n=1 Tax=Clostridium sp. LIBA-8841 TaxID=2987530 RepID=UPI002AC69952|nr:glycosyltransferase family 2 protein [Clostridium sp. LIBA-8841]MDZ5254360.1 glycosyltransferase [Clostridium sp. LIBA-8841]
MNKISLVMATVGRVHEVEAFINTLEKQKFSNYELIIVDQNTHYLLEEIYEKYKDKIKIKYIRSEKKGLSLNRNIGIKYVTGNIIAFPDDDCEYDEDTLLNVDQYFNNNDKEIYCCKVVDKNTGAKFGKTSDLNEMLAFNNIMKNCVSISIFIKFKNIEHIKFDEKLGAGTYFGSGEESDLIFKLLHYDYKGDYFSDKVVFHPARNDDNPSIENNNKDSLGLGALMKKEIYYRKNYKLIIFFISRLFRPAVGCIIKPKKSKFYMESIKYRVKGYLEYEQRE